MSFDCAWLRGELIRNFSVVHSNILVHRVTQLGFRSHPTGSSAPEAITMTFSFFRSDKLVYTTVSLRLIISFQPTQAMAGPVFSYLWNPYPTFPGGVQDFYSLLNPALGRPYWEFPDFGYLDLFRVQTPHQQFGAQGRNFGPPSLGFSFTIPPSYDRYRQHYSSVVSYINKQGVIYLRTPLRIEVDLFLWLQKTKGMAIRTRHIPGCLNVIADCLS